MDTAMNIWRTTWIVGFGLLICVEQLLAQLIPPNWDAPSQWTILNDVSCSISLGPYPSGQNGDGIVVQYQLKPERGWVIMRKAISYDISANSVTFLIKTNSTDDIELKFVDSDGSVFGRKVSMVNRFADWTRVTIYLNNTSYWWGGDNTFGILAYFEIAISGTGTASVWIDEIGKGVAGLQPTFSLAGPALDPDRELAGVGFRQRRADAMIPEDSLVLEWLKVIQDNASTDRKLVPSTELDNEAQTFNNSLVAMAFILKNERERAERILDFYANATNVNNTDPALQNFFYNGEARGFYQHVSLTTYRDEGRTADRWIGDMAWLLLSYKFYQQQYATTRYDTIVALIRNLFISYYRPEGNGGYIRHGWRNGDRYLHEANGHHEGNIDCYAVFKLLGEDVLALNIRNWLDAALTNAVDLPLDLYTWRVLAFGSNVASLLNVAEYDFRYRKVLTVSGRQIMGFYHGPDIEINNFWNDGTGHMACAFHSVGQSQRGFFYSNQMDSLLIEKVLFGKRTRSLPYTLNRTGGYAWVDTTKGFSATCAWYILAKNRFNPLTLQRLTTSAGVLNQLPSTTTLYDCYPNPFNPSTAIKFRLPIASHVTVTIHNLLGETLAVLIDAMKSAGEHAVTFDAGNLPGGTYFYTLSTDEFTETKKMLLIR